MKKNNLIACLLFLSLFAILPSNAASNGEDFKAFLKRFTSSAAFQYSRIKFPLKTDIILSTGDGENEKHFPFTKKEWPLLDDETFVEERNEVEGEGVYVSKFTVNETNHVEFEAGYEESELDLRVTFDLIDGKWFLTDCYTGWFNFNVLASEFNQTVREIQAENKEFIKLHP
ncbi:DUF4348 domain-containing protein [Bacteroides sedimenti]|uniref:DUF4348 domain-containing protein n=1 Tax=Bacteroides sedimenti TaxID=2136147 RepID=A0ABN6Z684_9BACE